jgi:hypothetical protein
MDLLFLYVHNASAVSIAYLAVTKETFFVRRVETVADISI